MLPDGWYIFRLVASALPSNAPERALEAERLTEPILIDNPPPVLRATAPRLTGRRGEVTFTAADAHGDRVLARRFRFEAHGESLLRRIRDAVVRQELLPAPAVHTDFGARDIAGRVRGRERHFHATSGETRRRCKRPSRSLFR